MAGLSNAFLMSTNECIKNTPGAPEWIGSNDNRHNFQEWQHLHSSLMSWSQEQVYFKSSTTRGNFKTAAPLLQQQSRDIWRWVVSGWHVSIQCEATSEEKIQQCLLPFLASPTPIPTSISQKNQYATQIAVGQTEKEKETKQNGWRRPETQCTVEWTS